MPKDVMHYKNYRAEISFDSEAGTSRGHVVAAAGMLDFHGRTPAELRRKLKKSVEEYIARRQEEDAPAAKTLKELLLEMPDAGGDADFERARER